MVGRFFWLAVDQLLKPAGAPYRADRVIRQLQFRLGIGSGGAAETSGEEAPMQLLRRSGLSAPVIFDVGANAGQYLALAKSVLADQQPVIHSFEPSATAFEALRTAWGGTPGVHLNACGLAETAGHREFFADAPGSPLGSLTRRRLDHLQIETAHREQVYVDSLDGYCAARGIDRIDLLKIDVEGHELDVLRGAEQMLARRAIRMVCFEFGGCNIDTRTFVRDFWYFFECRGMCAMHRIMPNGRLFRISAYDEGVEAFRTTNFLAVFDEAIAIGLD